MQRARGFRYSTVAAILNGATPCWRTWGLKVIHRRYPNQISIKKQPLIQFKLYNSTNKARRQFESRLLTAHRCSFYLWLRMSFETQRRRNQKIQNRGSSGPKKGHVSAKNFKKKKKKKRMSQKVLMPGGGGGGCLAAWLYKITPLRAWTLFG